MPATGVDLELVRAELVTGRRDDKVDALALGLSVLEPPSIVLLTEVVVVADPFLTAALVPIYLCPDTVLFLATVDVVTAVLVARLIGMEAFLRDKGNFFTPRPAVAVLLIVAGGRETGLVTGSARDI